MQSLNNILKKFIKELGLESGLTLQAIKNQWEHLVGQTIALHTSPDTIKGKILTLVVDTPQWMHHLSFYKQEIVEKLDRYNINEVRFRLGKLPTIIKKEREGTSNIECLKEEDKMYIKDTISVIKDEELKKRVKTLLIHSLTKGNPNLR